MIVPALAIALLLALDAPVNAQQPAAPVATSAEDPMLAPVPRAKTEIATWANALSHVRARSTDLRIAMDEVLRAEGQQRVALAGALPQINGTGANTQNLITNDARVASGLGPGGVPITSTVTVPEPNFFSGSAGAVQPVLAIRAWYGIGTASVARDVAQLTLEETKRVISISVASAIVGVVTAERIAELNRIGLRNSFQRLDLATRKSLLGGATGLDVVRARQDVESARAVLVAGDESLRRAREALGLALGLPEAVGVTAGVSIDGLEAATRASCPAVPTLLERPDLRASKTQTVLAHRFVNDVKNQFFPIITLQSNVASTTIDTGPAPNTTWNVLGVLTVPIWDGGARYGNLRSTEAQELQAGERFTALQRNATIEVVQARRGVSVTEVRRQVAAAQRDLALEADRLVRLTYQEGRATSLELVVAAQALREVETNLALRDFELVRARVIAALAQSSCQW